MEHVQEDTPVYVVCVRARPTFSGKGKEAYYEAVRNAASKVIEKLITSADIAIEIEYSTSVEACKRLDADNVNKPTLDALKGVAYNDDAQVRSVACTVIDLNHLTTLKGKADEMERLLFSNEEHVVLIKIYSDSRLKELGGAEKAEQRRLKDWSSELELFAENDDDMSA